MRIPFTRATRKIKYLGITLTKDVQGRCSENHRTLKKETEEYTIYRVHGLELTSLNCPYYPRQSIDSMRFLLNYQWHISQI